MKFVRPFFISSLVLFGPLLSVSTAKAFTVEAAKAGELSLQELKTLVSKKGATLLDANGTDMFKDGHIPGAVNFEAHKASLAKVLPEDKKTLIVAYCGGPMCTAWEAAADEAIKLGYTNVKHFKGGIKGWKEAGGKTEKGI